MQYETNLDIGVLISSTVESEKDGNFENICAKAKIYPDWNPSDKTEPFNSRVREEIQHALDSGPEAFSAKRATFDRARISATDDMKKALDHVSNINVTLLLMQDAQKWLDANAASNARIEKEKNSYNRYVKTRPSSDGEYTEQIENAAYKLWLRFYPKSYHKKPMQSILRKSSPQCCQNTHVISVCSASCSTDTGSAKSERGLLCGNEKSYPLMNSRMSARILPPSVR